MLRASVVRRAISLLFVDVCSRNNLNAHRFAIPFSALTRILAAVASSAWCSIISLLIRSFSWLLVALSLSSALGLPPPRLLPRDLHAAKAPLPSSGNENFDQFIDHGSPKLGSFSQRYWRSDEFWAGPDSPVKLTALVQV